MPQQGTFADFGGAELEATETTNDADTTMTTTAPMVDKHRRKTYAEELRTDLEEIDGVEEVIIDDATPGSWESVRLAVILPGEMGWVTSTERGVNIDDSVNLRSVAQCLNNQLDSNEDVSMFEVISRPQKLDDTYHDSTLYLVDAYYP